MATFLNKKERVYDLTLTSYGRYLLSIGSFKPVYYTFMDDNILYDGAYANITESQNSIQPRIKEQYHFESPILYTDVGDFARSHPGGALNRWESIYSMERTVPRRDVGKTNAMLGDMLLEDKTDAVPSWKVVTLQGIISSSQYADFGNDDSIPQVNITLNYDLQVQPSEYVYDPESSIDIIGQTNTFIDDQIIKLVTDDAMIYIEEENTQMLAENYDIEVFKVDPPASDYGKAIGSLTFFPLDIAVGDTLTINGNIRVVFTYVGGSSTLDNEIRYIASSTIAGRTKNAINAYTDRTGILATRPTPEVVELIATRPGRRSNQPVVYNSTTGKPDAIITTGMAGGIDVYDDYYRKYFQKNSPQIENGYMMSPTPNTSDRDWREVTAGQALGAFTTSSVEYYFDVLTDTSVNQAKACESAESFNKQSYYVDFDFDCSEKTSESIFYDIYGRTTEPEICQT